MGKSAKIYKNREMDSEKIGVNYPEQFHRISRTDRRRKKKLDRAVLFFDIDGTVLSEITKEVPVSAINAMKAAQQAGHLLFINTGRYRIYGKNCLCNG